MSNDMSSDEVRGYLRISRETLYRLVKLGRLTGKKIPRGWRFKRADVEAYKNYRRRIKYYGRIFLGPVLIKYRQARHKYQITTKHKGDVGWLSLNEKYLKGLSKRELTRQHFKPIRYHRVYLEGKYPIIVVREQDFDRLPRAEKSQWLRFKMKPKRILEEIS